MTHLRPDILATPNDAPWKCIFFSRFVENTKAPPLAKIKPGLANFLSTLNHSLEEFATASVSLSYPEQNESRKYAPFEMQTTNCTRQSNTLNCREVYCCFSSTRRSVEVGTFPKEKAFLPEPESCCSDFGAFAERLFVVWRRELSRPALVPSQPVSASAVVTWSRMVRGWSVSYEGCDDWWVIRVSQVQGNWTSGIRCMRRLNAMPCWKELFLLTHARRFRIYRMFEKGKLRLTKMEMLRTIELHNAAAYKCGYMKEKDLDYARQIDVKLCSGGF